MSQEPRKMTLCDLPNDAWREIGELISLQGIQDLWWTGSRQLHASLKRVVFRTLRGSLPLSTNQLLVKCSSSVDELQSEFGMCFQLQAEELIIQRSPPRESAFPTSRAASTAQVTATLYLLASYILKDRERRNVSFSSTTQLQCLSVPWLCFCEDALQLSLVRNPEDDDKLGTHVLATALLLRHSTYRTFRDNLWHKLHRVDGYRIESDSNSDSDADSDTPGGAPQSFLEERLTYLNPRHKRPNHDNDPYGYYNDYDEDEDEFDEDAEYYSEEEDVVDRRRYTDDLPLEEFPREVTKFPSLEFFYGVQSLQRVRVCILVVHGEQTFNLRCAANLTHFEIHIEPIEPSHFSLKIMSGDSLTNLTVKVKQAEDMNAVALDVHGMKNLRSLKAAGIHWPSFWRIHQKHLEPTLESLELIYSVISDDAWNMLWPSKLQHLTLHNVFINHEKGVSSPAWDAAHARMSLSHQKKRTINLLNLPSSLKSLHFNSGELNNYSSLTYTLPTSEVIEEWSADTEAYIERPMKPSYEDLRLSTSAFLSIGKVYLQGRPLPCASLESLSLSGAQTSEIFDLLPKSITSLYLFHSANLSHKNDKDAVSQVFSLVFPKAAKLISQESPLPNLLSFRLTSNKISRWNFLLPLETYLQVESSVDLLVHRQPIDLADWLLHSLRVVLGLPQRFDEENLEISAEQWKQLHLRWDTAMETRAKGRTLWTPKVRFPPQVTALEWRGDVNCPIPFTTVTDEPSQGLHAVWDASKLDSRMNFVLRQFQYPFAMGCLSAHIERLELHDVSIDVLRDNDWHSLTSLRWLLISTPNAALHDFLLPNLIELILYANSDWPGSQLVPPAKLNLRRLVTSARIPDKYLHAIYSACEDLKSVEIVQRSASPGRLYEQLLDENLSRFQAQAMRSDAISTFQNPQSAELTSLEEFYAKNAQQDFARDDSNLHSAFTELTFTGFEWPQDLPIEGTEDSPRTTIHLGTIREHLLSLLPSCAPHRMGLTIGASWGINEGVTVLDLTRDPQYTKRKTDASISPLPDWNTESLKINLHWLRMPSTLTELYLQSISDCQLKQDIFSYLPASLLKLHIYDHTVKKLHKRSRALTDAKLPPPNIQDIFAPNIYLIVDGRPDLTQWSSSLTRLVCNSTRAQETKIPSNLETLIIKGKILRHPLKMTRRRTARRPPAQAVPTADLPISGPRSRFQPNVPSAGPSVAAPPPKKKRAIPDTKMD